MNLLTAGRAAIGEFDMGENAQSGPLTAAVKFNTASFDQSLEKTVKPHVCQDYAVLLAFTQRSARKGQMSDPRCCCYCMRLAQHGIQSVDGIPGKFEAFHCNLTSKCIVVLSYYQSGVR